MPRSPGPCAFGATTEFGWGLTLVALHQDPRGSLDDPVDLDAAVDELRIAVDTCPPDDLRRPSFLCNLGLALKQRHASLRSIADLTEAVERFRLPSGPPRPVTGTGRCTSRISETHW